MRRSISTYVFPSSGTRPKRPVNSVDPLPPPLGAKHSISMRAHFSPTIRMLRRGKNWTTVYFHTATWPASVLYIKLMSSKVMMMRLYSLGHRVRGPRGRGWPILISSGPAGWALGGPPQSVEVGRLRCQPAVGSQTSGRLFRLGVVRIRCCMLVNWCYTRGDACAPALTLLKRSSSQRPRAFSSLPSSFSGTLVTWIHLGRVRPPSASSSPVLPTTPLPQTLFLDGWFRFLSLFFFILLRRCCKPLSPCNGTSFFYYFVPDLCRVRGSEGQYLAGCADPFRSGHPSLTSVPFSRSLAHAHTQTDALACDKNKQRLAVSYSICLRWYALLCFTSSATPTPSG